MPATTQMPADPHPSDTVFLLAEHRSATSGRVHEIGTRARVVERLDGMLVLEIAGETLHCPDELVSTERSARARPPRAWVRRGGVVALS
jgi:hypothetical protein